MLKEAIKPVNKNLLGKKLAKPVIVNDIVLLDENTIIQQSHIELLSKWKVRSVFIFEFVPTRKKESLLFPYYPKKTSRLKTPLLLPTIRIVWILSIMYIISF